MKRETFREWMPPKVWNWLRLRFSGYRIVKNWPAASDGGWECAADEAAVGYDNGVRRLVEGIPIGFEARQDITFLSDNDKNMHNIIAQLGLIVAKTAMRCGDLRILDYGGGFGIHELAIKRFFPQMRYEYTVCELPEFCEKGRRINDRVRFVPCLEQAGTGYHLVYASGSLQYSKEWRALIADLCSATIGSVFINRTPFVFREASFITVQRAYGTEYPGWVFNFNEVVEEFSKKGLGLKEVFVSGRGVPIVGVDQQSAHLGILFEKMVKL